MEFQTITNKSFSIHTKVNGLHVCSVLTQPTFIPIELVFLVKVVNIFDRATRGLKLLWALNTALHRLNVILMDIDFVYIPW